MNADIKTKEEFEDYLIKRSKNDNPYSQLSNSAYICNKASVFDEELANCYVKAYKDTTLKSWLDEAHVFKLLNDMYLSMRRTSKDQCLSLLGHDSKVEQIFKIANYLNLLCGNTNRIKKLTLRFTSSISVITAMTTIAEDRRCGLSIQLQFNSVGKWSGAYIQEGPFDSFRLTNKKSVRNFDIFYALLAGISDAEKTKWHLSGPSSFKLTFGELSAKDKTLYDIVNSSFDKIGFSTDMITLFWQTIAGLLHLSNITFTTSDTTTHQNVTIVQNQPILELCAGLFGVEPKSIEASLTISTINSVTQLLKIQESEVQRDQLIKQLYTVLLSWIIEFSNKKLKTSEFANSMWILDPTTINPKDKQNDLFSMLNNIYYESILKLSIDKLYLEPLELIKSQNQDIQHNFQPDFSSVDLAMSILSILELESVKGSNHGSINQTIKSQCSDHSKFSTASSTSSFGISHFNSTIYYDCTLMATENIAIISPDLVSLFQGSAEFSASTHGILLKAFQSKTIKSLSQIHFNLSLNKSSINKFQSLHKNLSKLSNCHFWTLFHNDLTFTYDLLKLTPMLYDRHFSHQEFATRYPQAKGDFNGPNYAFLKMEQFRTLEYESRAMTSVESVVDDDISDIQSEISEMPVEEEEVVEDIQQPLSKTRRRWLCFVHATTCCCCNCCLRKMESDQVKMAWREKIALNVIILVISAIMLFFIIGFGPLLCPPAKVYNVQELGTRRGAEDGLFAVAGRVFEVKELFQISSQHSSRPVTVVDEMAGRDLTIGMYRFRRPEFYCDGATVKKGLELQISPQTLDANITKFASYHTFSDNVKLDTYIFKTGKQIRTVAWDPSRFQEMLSDKESPRSLFQFQNNVYDLTGLLPNIKNKDYQFLDNYVQGLTEFLSKNQGTDLTNSVIVQTAFKIANFRKCMTAFYVGVIDARLDYKCQISNYLLLSTSCFMVILILFKFLAALKTVGRSHPTGLEKYVIIQVPCYTESRQSLLKTIDSITTMDYDDKRKLLIIVCDGMVVGSGNDKPTPALVLDILGIEDTATPLSFVSLGEGMKQHNMAKIYSGLYEKEGHIVPYIVIVKVGTQQERIKPGNRGKRDSQMLLMRFLNKCLYNTPMSPMELELCHHMLHVIGTSPSQYDLMLMVDADTELVEDSLSHLVSLMVTDTKVIGCCGETKLANEGQSWSTMIQVYEYFISHHLAKAFESMFGSVTCLPGCFCMYRIHRDTKEMYLVNNLIISAYGDNNSETLHKKNLLSLGEDRFLTTLMLKHFPYSTMSFNPRAKCLTIAPDRYDVLLSQRRRWINSTIHNLAELLYVEQLCGFCCFSMRFVVFIDLFSTVVQPAGIVYLVYLLGTIAYNYITEQPDRQLPLIALYLLAAVYGMQAIIFIIKREFQHIGWMIIYVLAMPIFGFALPVYAFWHMDDFSYFFIHIVGEIQEQLLEMMVKRL